MSRRTTAAVVAIIVGFLCWGPAAYAKPIETYITGELLVPTKTDVIFRYTGDSAFPLNGNVAVRVTDAHGLDGIDFVPKSFFPTAGKFSHIVTTAPGVPQLSHQNVSTGLVEPVDFITNTNVIGPAPPPGGSGSTPSSVLSTSSHVLYIENQFGFSPTGPHRIMRHNYGLEPGGLEDVVFDGANPAVVAAFPSTTGLRELEGLEIVGGRLYFFAKDPTSVDGARTRALMSAPLTGGIVLPGTVPDVEIAGLFRAALTDAAGVGPGFSDGSDELDFDPVTGYIFGTNIGNGEVIAFDPLAAGPPPGGEVIPGLGGSLLHFVDPGDPFLSGAVDGIRSDGAGHLVFVGRAGVIGSIDVASVLAGGASPANVFPLFLDPNFGMGPPVAYVFDELTPLIPPIPEPSTFTLALMALVGLLAVGRRRVRT